VSPHRLLRHTTTSGRVSRPQWLAVGLVVVATTLAGCSAQEMPRLAMPEPATKEGNTILFLWQTSWIAALVVGVITWGLIAWAVIAYSRRRRPGYPEQTRYNMPIEILYTVIPFVMIGVLFYFTARDETRLTKLSSDYDHTVGVVGFRWAWAFNYVDEKAYDVGIPATNNAEVDVKAKSPEQGYTGPTLWLPVDEKVRFVLNSPDVIHSFYVPAFLFKMDVIPGRTNQFELTPNKLGTYAGKCTELCGIDHSRMLFNVKVVTKAEYLAHIAELKARGQSGELKSGRISRNADGGQGVTTIGGKVDNS
jgi:cytochrome c oxidase subunit 2